MCRGRLLADRTAEPQHCRPALPAVTAPRLETSYICGYVCAYIPHVQELNCEAEQLNTQALLEHALKLDTQCR